MELRSFAVAALGVTEAAERLRPLGNEALIIKSSARYNFGAILLFAKASDYSCRHPLQCSAAREATRLPAQVTHPKPQLRSALCY